MPVLVETWDELVKSEFPVSGGDLQPNTIYYQFFPADHNRGTRPVLLGAVTFYGIQPSCAIPLCLTSGLLAPPERHIATPWTTFTHSRAFDNVLWTPYGKLLDRFNRPNPDGIKPWPFVLLPRERIRQISFNFNPRCEVCDRPKWLRGQIRRQDWARTNLPLVDFDQFRIIAAA